MANNNHLELSMRASIPVLDQTCRDKPKMGNQCRYASGYRSDPNSDMYMTSVGITGLLESQRGCSTPTNSCFT